MRARSETVGADVALPTPVPSPATVMYETRAHTTNLYVGLGIVGVAVLWGDRLPRPLFFAALAGGGYYAGRGLYGLARV